MNEMTGKTNDVLFRRARKEEEPGIVRMQSEIFHREQGIPEEDLNSFLSREPLFWCAEREHRICAAAAAWRENGEWHWGRFFVLPEHRREGIGAALAAFTFADLFRGDAERVCMEARDTTVKIVCRLGGKISGEPFFFYGADVTPVVLEKADLRRTVSEQEENIFA